MYTIKTLELITYKPTKDQHKEILVENGFRYKNIRKPSKVQASPGAPPTFAWRHPLAK